MPRRPCRLFNQAAGAAGRESGGSPGQVAPMAQGPRHPAAVPRGAGTGQDPSRRTPCPTRAWQTPSIPCATAKGTGARHGDAIQNALETRSQSGIPVPRDGKRWIPWDGKHWGSRAHPSPPKTSPRPVSILHPWHITASDTSTFFWWFYPPPLPRFLFNPFISPPPPCKCQGKVLTDFLEGNV